MRLDDVAFRYSRKGPWILQAVSLSLPPGRITEVTGRNGAGKSTLLRLVAGLRPPRRGAVIDRPQRVGYAPERFPTDQPFTVRSYLSHMAAVRGVTLSVIDEWAERLRFGHLLGVRLPELSKGSAHKVGLTQAFLAGPGLLVLDEPFAGLDTETRDTLPALLAELASEGAIVVLSDHQRCLDGLPAIHRVHVADNTVRPHTPDDTDLDQASQTSPVAQPAPSHPRTASPPPPLSPDDSSSTTAPNDQEPPSQAHTSRETANNHANTTHASSPPHNAPAASPTEKPSTVTTAGGAAQVGSPPHGEPASSPGDDANTTTARDTTHASSPPHNAPAASPTEKPSAITTAGSAAQAGFPPNGEPAPSPTNKPNTTTAGDTNHRAGDTTHVASPPQNTPAASPAEKPSTVTAAGGGQVGSPPHGGAAVRATPVVGRVVGTGGERAEGAGRDVAGHDQAASGVAWAVLEVVVRADEVDAVEARLRADGHQVRRRAGQ
ncbi:ABC transporter ATP-binding protein [Actinomadura miaoliensis]|uniref:ABC transporter domain-containing protein n=1 Tax=Actinomadura miaoliensis TaxID=430685 RepID=A0ABP7VUW3_9ACTN